MDELKQKLQRLNNRALEILETPQGFWHPPESESPFLIDLQREFSVHWLTCTKSLTTNVTALVAWYATTFSKGPAVDFVIGQIDTAMNALQAPTIDRFIDLSIIIAESFAKVAGLEIVMVVFDARGLWEKIKSVINLGKSELTPLNILLPKLELAMEQMLLAALYFEMTVDRLTRQTGAPSDVISMNDLKKPVIELLQYFRGELNVVAGEATRVGFVEEGFWPAGLRGDVPDVTWNRSSS